MTGVPKLVRVEVSKRFEEDEGKRGGRENYFDLIHYSKIAAENWEIFEPLLAYDKTGKKEARLRWISVVNEKRNIVSHPSSAITLAVEDLALLLDYEHWLAGKMTASTSAEPNEPMPQPSAT